MAREIKLIHHTSEKGDYIFKVPRWANKNEISKVIEKEYKVKPRKINIINISAKRRRLGRIEGWKKGYKKAIIFLKANEKIEIKKDQ